MAKNPIVSYKPHDDKKPVVYLTCDKKWNFSFRFWRQIQYFGLDTVEPKWFVSLLEKLKNLSQLEISKFLANKQTRNAYRYHQINWNQKNIPIQRKELYWIDKDYLDNPEEFPLVQFQLSKALGRVIGFWDENTIFNIVLLDPLHNIQPSKDFYYKVNPCDPLSCEYTSLLMEIENIKLNSKCDGNKCGYKTAINSISTKGNYKNALIHYIDDETLSAIQNLKESTTEILKYGLIFLTEPKKEE